MSLPDPTLPGTPESESLIDDSTGPARVMCFNASDPSAATGLAADITTVASMGAYALPITTALLLRDTAQVFEAHPLDAEWVAEQARSILEDVSLSAWKIGYLGNPDIIASVAEIISDYSETPLLAYLPHIAWLEDDELATYWDVFRELILPSSHILVGNQKILTDFLLPDWSHDKPPSPRQLADAAQEHGTPLVLVTNVACTDHQHIDNVLANAQGVLMNAQFERFSASFVGAGETLSAAMIAMIATGSDPTTAAAEALNFLDQALHHGFRPGMGQVIPDRLFWAVPSDEEIEALSGEEQNPSDDSGEGDEGGDGEKEDLTVNQPALKNLDQLH